MLLLFSFSRWFFTYLLLICYHLIDQTLVFKSCTDSSDAKRLATDVNISDPRRWPYRSVKTDASCRSGCDMLKNPNCSMHIVMSAEQRSKFAVFHRRWWRLHIEWKFLERGENQQTNKKQNYIINCLCKNVLFKNTLNWDVSRSTR